jgi:hypothetical protein
VPFPYRRYGPDGRVIDLSVDRMLPDGLCAGCEVRKQGFHDGFFMHRHALRQHCLDSLAEIALAARVQGGAIHDARIAAICRFHGVRELWSADRDFSRFAAVKVRNPLLA